MKTKDLVLELFFLVRLPLIILWRLGCRPFVSRRTKARQRQAKVAARTAAGRGVAGRLQPERILLIRLDRLGDCVLSLPLVHNLRLAFPHARIDVLARPELKEFFGMVREVDRCLAYRGFWRTARRLAAQGYDLAIDPLYDYPLKTAFLAYAAGAAVRAGFERGYRGLLFTHAVKIRKRNTLAMPLTNLRLLDRLGIKPQVSVPRLSVAPAERFPEQTIAVHPGARFASQQWPAEKFRSLVEVLLAAYPAKIIVLGASRERSQVRQIVEGLPRRRVQALFLSLSEMSRVLAGCALLICNNSGPLHLAAALGVATVSTMGPTDPALWKPAGERHTVLRKRLRCSPCNRAQCRDHRCLRSITVQEMLAAVKPYLERR